MIPFLLLITGYLLTTRFLKDISSLERIAYTLFFSLTAVPFAAINISLLGPRYITQGLLLFVSIVLLVFLAVSILLSMRNPKASDVQGFGRKESATLLLAVPIAFFAYFYYTNTEFLLSLASYLERGEAKCFYMETFRFIETMNPGVNPVEIRGMYSIIGTPGNALFTAGLMPTFGADTFRILYVSFQVMLFLFVFLLMDRWTGRSPVSIGIALFSILNPYSLSIEVLDRNAMALALSAVLFYTLFAHREKTFLLGLIFGITSGVGLRFLPLTFALPVFLFYLSEKAGVRSFITFLAGFVVAFAFNVPHLFFHGFHSLGETMPFYELLLQAFTQWTRTPVLPYPNAIFYFLKSLNHLGLFCSSLVVFGAVRMIPQNRRRFFVLVTILFIPCLALFSQRDWIEGDKARILLTVFLPLMLFLGTGLSSLLSRDRLVRNLTIFVSISAILTGSSILARGIEGREDSQAYTRKPIYQTMTVKYMQFYREHFSPLRLLPDYRGLFLKKELRRKLREENIVKSTLFTQDRPERISQNRWVQEHLLRSKIPISADLRFSDVYHNIRIDFEKLVVGMENAVTVVPHPDRLFVDFEDEQNMLDLYHKECTVSWQARRLPVTLFPLRPERPSLKELNIELNAFIGFGKDEYGFEKVNAIHYMMRPETHQDGFDTGMTALPQTDDDSSIVLRIPQDLTIIIRNWIVNGNNGTPYRIDSWEVKVSGKGKPQIEFFCGEPESYL